LDEGIKRDFPELEKEINIKGLCGFVMRDGLNGVSYEPIDERAGRSK
jgi:hypothetical protein